MSRRWCILVVDGGGIRGVIPAYIVKRLEADLGRPMYKVFHCIGGTSTGGIIAMGLTAPVVQRGAERTPWTGSEILDFYLKDEARIYVPKSAGIVCAKYVGADRGDPRRGVEAWLREKLTPDLSLSAAARALRALEGSKTLNAFTAAYCIAADDGEDIGPVVFDQVEALRNADVDYFVWEAARATSAAPTYFPVARVGRGEPSGSSARAMRVVDGGVAANNPGLYALSHAAREEGLYDLRDITVVSLGTGLYNPGLRVGRGDWGALPWLFNRDARGHFGSPVLDMMMMGNVLAPAQQLADLMPKGNYWRLEPAVPYANWAIDAKDAPTVLALAEKYLAPGGAGHGLYQSLLDALGA